MATFKNVVYFYEPTIFNKIFFKFAKLFKLRVYYIEVSWQRRQYTCYYHFGPYFHASAAYTVRSYPRMKNVHKNDKVVLMNEKVFNERSTTLKPFLRTKGSNS